MSQYNVTVPMELDTKAFLQMLSDPEFLRGVAKIRIKNPTSDGRVFIMIPADHKDVDQPIEKIEDINACDIAEMAFDKETNVARIKTYGHLPDYLATLIMLRTNRTAINYRGAPAATYTFVVDSHDREAPGFRHGPNNYLMGVYGDIVTIPVIGDNWRVTDVQFLPLGDKRWSVKARAIISGKGHIFRLNDSCAPMKNLQEIKNDSWIEHDPGYAQYNIHSFITLWTNDGPMIAMATDRGVVVDINNEMILLSETKDQDIQTMSIDWSRVSHKDGRFIFRGNRQDIASYYIWDLKTRNVIPASFKDGISETLLDPNRRIDVAIGGNKIYLTDSTVRRTFTVPMPS